MNLLSCAVALVRQAIAFVASCMALILSGAIAGLAALTQLIAMAGVGVQYLGSMLERGLEKRRL